jgi:hypothetical protein
MIAAFTDTTPPLIKPVLPAPEKTTRINKPLIRASISDRGSGIAGSSSIRMSLDNIEVYSEFDVEARRVNYTHPKPLSRGWHTVSLTVTDRAGNSSTRSWRFRVTR